MSIRCLLIRLPGPPFTLETFMPEGRLASTAACLVGQGHSARIWDFGTAEAFDELFPGDWRERFAPLAAVLLDEPERAGGLRGELQRRIRPFARIMDGRLTARVERVAGRVASLPDLGLVVFHVGRREDLPMAKAVAASLREKCPDVRLVAVGAWIDVYGELLARHGAVDTFDALCVGDYEWALCELAGRLAKPETWLMIPNLVLTSIAARRVTVRRSDYGLEGLPLPRYDADTYPAFHDSTLARVVGIEMSRGCDRNCHACPLPTLSERRVRLAPVDHIRRTMSHLARTYGLRTFRFTGPGTPAFHAEAVAHGILAARMSVAYSQTFPPNYAEPGIAAVLRESGCEACAVRLDSGSQRLLDDYYGRGFGVTEVEQMLRACVAEDIFTEARIMYPSPRDDYNSRAETLRIVNRARPHTVTVIPPEAPPGSDWHCWLDEFGFSLPEKPYSRWIAGEDDLEMACAGRGEASPIRVGPRLLRKTEREYAEIVAELRETGVNTTVSAEVALLARVADYGGREAEFQRAIRRAILSGDALALASALEGFNRRACVPPHTIVCRPFTPVLAAVGN